MPSKSLKHQTARYDQVKPSSQPKAKPKAKPATTKPAARASTSRPKQGSSNDSKRLLSFQQRLLDAFKSSFGNLFSDVEELKALIQTVKGHLYDRDFAEAFAKEDYLEAYAVRWSPTRALGYVEILRPFVEDLLERKGISLDERLKATKLDDGSATNGKAKELSEDVTPPAPHVVCIGGGAGAEAVAFAGILHCILALEEDNADISKPAASKPSTESTATEVTEAVDQSFEGEPANAAEPPASGIEHTTSTHTITPPPAASLLQISLLDIASWSSVTDKLLLALTRAPPSPTISPFASAAARAEAKADSSNSASRAPLVSPGDLDVDFQQIDVLSQPDDVLAAPAPAPSATVAPPPLLVTFMFTLNELYSSSMAKTTALLLGLTGRMQSGARILVVDSPGSYSTVRVGKAKEKDEGAEHGEGAKGGDERQQQEEKKYPMHWLLDHTLLMVAKGEGKAKWTKEKEVESKWFRLAKGLDYPLGLEDMRYQMHLYRRI